MNISIVFTSEGPSCQAYLDMVEGLRSIISQDTAQHIGDESPDIVHLFGEFDWKTRHLLDRYHDLKIPTVLTVCNALSTYTQKHAELKQKSGRILKKQVLKRATAVHAIGETEAASLQTTVPNLQVATIANAAVTGATSFKEMTKALIHLYSTTMAKHEQTVQETIEKKLALVKVDAADEVAVVSKQLLYDKYLNTRGLLTTKRLEETAQLLIRTDYDEDRLAALLPKLGITTFTQELLALLEEQSLLTEGFMPIKRSKKQLKINAVNKL